MQINTNQRTHCKRGHVLEDNRVRTWNYSPQCKLCLEMRQAHHRLKGKLKRQGVSSHSELIPSIEEFAATYFNNQETV